MFPIGKEDLAIRIIIAFLIAMLAASLSPYALILTYIVFGYPHFMMALLYAHDGGRLSQSRMWVIGMLAIVLPFLAFQIKLTILLASIGLFFGLHFVIDEIRLLKSAYSPLLLLPFFGFFALYSALLMEYLTHVSFVVPAMCLAALSSGIWLIFFRKKDGGGGVGIVLWTLALALMYVFLPVHTPVFWFGFFALTHYALWYVLSLIKEVRAGRGKRYYIRTLYTHGIAIGAFLVSTQFSIPILGLLFVPVGFYGLTFLHIGTSIRLQDITHLFDFKKV